MSQAPTDYEKHLALFLRRRGVEDPCPKCRGNGSLHYSHGSTWRGGVGTAGFEWDVCDQCWGTGDAHRIGVDLRKQRNNERGRIEARAATLIADACMTSFPSLRAGILELCDELDRFERGRKKRPVGFTTVCGVLAKVLRRAMAGHDAVAVRLRSEEL